MRNIRKHSFNAHSWKSSSGRGRPKKGAANPPVPWRSGVLYQRFFVQGPKSGFFEVGRGRVEEENNPAPESQWDRVERLIDHGRARVAARERRRIAAIDESKEPSPWLRFTGWPEHLGRFDPVELQLLVRPPKPGQERELHIVYEVFVDMI